MHVNKRGKDQMVKLQTHNDSIIDINGTCLQGYVDASAEDLVEQFGAPMIGDSRDKVEYEWNIMIGDQPISTTRGRTTVRSRSSKSTAGMSVGVLTKRSTCSTKRQT